MARKQLPPLGKRKGPPPPPAPGRGRKAKLGPPGARAGAPPPLPSPPPRPRVAPGMPPPVQNKLPVREPDADDMGPTMSAAVGTSPVRRAAARAMRGGRVAF